MSSPDRPIGAGHASAFSQRVVAELFVVFAVLIWWLTSKQLPPNVFPSPYNVLLEMGGWQPTRSSGRTRLRPRLACCVRWCCRRS